MKINRDLEGWSKIVRLGGIVSGHDYEDSCNQCYRNGNAVFNIRIRIVIRSLLS